MRVHDAHKQLLCHVCSSELFISDNLFTGTFPSAMTSLSRLRFLQSSDTHLSGEVPTWMLPTPFYLNR